MLGCFALGCAAMSDNYGVTFAQKLIQRGEYEQAVTAAAEHARKDAQNPEPYHDRARALSLLGRYADAVGDYARALELDAEERILEDWEVDDGLFSTLVAWGQSLGEPGAASTPPQVQAEQVRVMQRYAELLPKGRHTAEAADWVQRFRGQLKTTFVKPRD